MSRSGFLFNSKNSRKFPNDVTLLKNNNLIILSQKCIFHELIKTFDLKL